MFEFNRLMDAYLECRRHKRGSVAALAFEINLEDNLVALYREIIENRYTISHSIAFVVEKPVCREVFAADFRDRIVHHLLMQLLIPHLEREFIYDSYACRPGRGTLFGVKRIKRFIGQCSQGCREDCYLLKCDISGFFMNIPRERLWQMLEAFIRKIDFGDSEILHNESIDLFTPIVTTSQTMELVLRLTRQIVMHNPIEYCRINGSPKRWNALPADKSLFGVNSLPMPNGYRATHNVGNEPRGLPIGNLTSQWFGNFYLNALDHYVKHTLGVRYYGRYVDDFVLVHKDREYLKETEQKIELFLREELQLTLHPRKRYLQHYKKGVVFLGTRIREGALLTGNRTKSGAYEVIHHYAELSKEGLLTSGQMSDFRNSINSYWGLMRHQSSYSLRRKMASQFSAQMLNRCEIKGYDKIRLKDYTFTSNRIAIPYIEWWRAFENKPIEKQIKKRAKI